MDENAKMAKTLKILSVVLGLGLVVIGAFRLYKGGDALALGEDGLLGVAVCLLGYGMSAILNKKESFPEDDKTEDEGI